MRVNMTAAALVALALSTACRQEPNIDKVPVGSDIQLTRQDGALVEGTLKERDAVAVKVDTGRTTREVPRTEIADVRVKDAANPESVPPKATFREITVPDGTNLSIRLDTAVSSESSSIESPVRGEITQAVIVDGVPVIPAGSAVSGTVTHAEPSGKVKGLASLGLEFNTLTIGNDTHRINARFSRTAASTKKADAQKIGIPAAGGAIIGAIIGGKKGAAIGATAGGGAGTAVVLATPGKEVVLPAGTVLSLDAGRPVLVRIPLR